MSALIFAIGCGGSGSKARGSGSQVLGAAQRGSPASASSEAILEFDDMTAVSGQFVGPANPVRGLAGGGLPWVISEGHGELSADGVLELEVEGLVLAAGPLKGTNPINPFQAVVSCRTTDAAGKTTIKNVVAGRFETSSAGNGELEAAVDGLPSPCNDPVVFVTTPTTPPRWLAATRF